MMNWISSLLGRGNHSVPTPTVQQTKNAASASSAATSKDPCDPVQKKLMYYIDVDESKEFFVRYVHVTSSVHSQSIESTGLRPWRNQKQDLLDYLTKVFAGQDAQALLNTILQERSSGEAALVRGRFAEGALGRFGVYLLHLGEELDGYHSYLRSAAKNAVEDGGEVFKAARLAVNTLIEGGAIAGTKGAPPHPYAHADVFVVHHALTWNSPELSLQPNGLEEGAINVREALATRFQGEYWSPYRTHIEIRSDCVYTPSDLQRMTLDEYIQTPKAAISPSAKEELIRRFNAAGQANPSS